MIERRGNDCLKTRETRILRCPAIRPDFIASWKIIRPKRDTQRMIFIFKDSVCTYIKEIRLPFKKTMKLNQLQR